MRRSRGKPAVRRRHEGRTGWLPVPDERSGVTRAAPRLLRRTRLHEDSGRAGGHAAAADQDRCGDRRRHHGRRHRDELRQCRHSGASARGQAGGARQGPVHHPPELREPSQEGQAHRRKAGAAHGADQADAQLCRAGAGRHRHRGCVRGHAGQAEGVRAARRGDEAGRDSREQHLDAGPEPDRLVHEAAGGCRRPALLLAGERDAPARSRARREDREGRPSGSCPSSPASATASSATA
jgi:hypothetical protein